MPVDCSGTITLQRFSVVGDFQTIQFLREDPDVPEGRIETWTRATARSDRGRYVLTTYLYWPNFGGQYPRGAITTINVE